MNIESVSRFTAAAEVSSANQLRVPRWRRRTQGAARRTPRRNLRFTGRRVVPQLYPADAPLPRERSEQLYSPAEIGGHLVLARPADDGAADARGRAGLPGRGHRADPR